MSFTPQSCPTATGPPTSRSPAEPTPRTASWSRRTVISATSTSCGRPHFRIREPCLTRHLRVATPRHPPARQIPCRDPFGVGDEALPARVSALPVAPGTTLTTPRRAACPWRRRLRGTSPRRPGPQGPRPGPAPGRHGLGSTIETDPRPDRSHALGVDELVGGEQRNDHLGHSAGQRHHGRAEPAMADNGACVGHQAGLGPPFLHSRDGGQWCQRPRVDGTACGHQDPEGFAGKGVEDREIDAGERGQPRRHRSEGDVHEWMTLVTPWRWWRTFHGGQGGVPESHVLVARPSGPGRRPRLGRN